MAASVVDNGIDVGRHWQENFVVEDADVARELLAVQHAPRLLWMVNNTGILFLLASEPDIETKNQIENVTVVEGAVVGSIDIVGWVAVENTDGVPLGTHHGLPDNVDDIHQNDDGQNILGILEDKMVDRKSQSSVAGHHELAVGNSSKSEVDAERTTQHKAGVMGIVVHAMTMVPYIRLWLGKASTLELREHYLSDPDIAYLLRNLQTILEKAAALLPLAIDYSGFVSVYLP